MDKKILMFALGLFSFAILASMVSGAITFINPSSAGQTITGTYTFNVTTALPAAHNCTWSTTADANFLVVSNTSASQTAFFNTTFPSTTLTNAEDTTLSIICRNSTSANETSTLVVNVDNTNPTCSFSVNRDVVEINTGVPVETTQSSTDTTDLTYAWTLFRSDNTQSTTSTSASPTFSLSDFDQPDEFTLALVVTDEASLSTACTNQSILVQGSDGSSDAVVTSTQTNLLQKIGGVRTIILLGGAFVVIMVAFIVIYSVGQTKRRR